MIKSAQYRILPELKINVEYFSVHTSLADMLTHRKAMIIDPEYDAGYNFVTDFRETDLDFSMADILRYIEFAEKFPKATQKRRAAILTTTPNQSVVSNLYVLNLQKLPLIVNIFSTVDAAIFWLGLTTRQMDIVTATIAEMQDVAMRG